VPDLCLGAVTGSVDERAVEWRRRVGSVEAPVRAATGLYLGDHWRAVCDAYRLALAYSSRAELWVISAGYGLINGTRPLKAYSATFASGARDSVWRGSEDGDRRACMNAWWAGLRHDVTLADLVEGGAIIVVAAGAPYVDAISADLRLAVAEDATSDRISVISAGSRGNGALLPVSGTLRRALGGTDAALNARVLAYLAATAERHQFRRSLMRAALAELAATFPPTERTVGSIATDPHIIEQIEGLRRREPTISRTRALRMIRAAGTACEQARFASLWGRALSG
jgi:hypothetical protein